MVAVLVAHPHTGMVIPSHLACQSHPALATPPCHGASKGRQPAALTSAADLARCDSRSRSSLSTRTRRTGAHIPTRLCTRRYTASVLIRAIIIIPNLTNSREHPTDRQALSPSVLRLFRRRGNSSCRVHRKTVG